MIPPLDAAAQSGVNPDQAKRAQGQTDWTGGKGQPPIGQSLSKEELAATQDKSLREVGFGKIQIVDASFLFWANRVKKQQLRHSR